MGFGARARILATGGIAASAIAVAAVVSGGGPAAGTANLWVDTNGGACTRQVVAQPYSDGAACASFDAAWDAATAGDTVRVKAGTYPIQCISGDKASDTKIIGEGDGTVVIVERDSGLECKAVFGGGSTVGLLGTHVWLENMTLDALDTDGVGAGIRVWPEADDARLVDVNVDGDLATAYIEGDAFEWYGGRLRDNPTPVQTTCSPNSQSNVAMWLFAGNSVIEGVEFGRANRQDTPTPGQGACGGDGIPHIETVRFEDAAENVTFRNNVFVRGSEIGSGHMFSSATHGALRLIGNFFGESGDNPMVLQLTNLTATGTLFAYNTFEETAFNNGTAAFPMIGNLGPGNPGCGGTHTGNVWQGSGSCGSDTYVGSTNLEIDASGHIGATSPAIDAAETPGASDYCTDPAIVGSVDKDGDTRPQGADCDAGADERP